MTDLIPAEFWFSLLLLLFLRIARSVTWLVFALSTLLTVAGINLYWCSHGYYGSHHYIWLAAIGWVTVLRGSEDPVWIPFLLPFAFGKAGAIGIVTGLFLHLPLPRKKSLIREETYGIYRSVDM